MQLFEAFVVGAVAGFGSVVLMTLFEVPYWRRFGMEGVVEWQVNQIMVSWLFHEQYDPARRMKEAIGMHLLHGTIIGMILGAVLNSLTSTGIFYYISAAVVLSFILWLFTLLLRGRFETIGKVRFSETGLLVSLASHMVYGVALGVGLAIVVA